MTFERLLVPLDGSAEAAAVLPTAKTLARIADAEILLLRAVTPPVAILDDHAEERDAATEYLEGVVEEIRRSGIRATTEVRPGIADGVILRAARENEADLIVMTTRGRSGMIRMVLGSVASGVISRSTVPVVVFRPGERSPETIQTLIVPVTASPGAALALGAASGLARATGARLVLLQVAPPIPLWAYDATAGFYLGPNIDSAWDEEARSAAQHYVDGLAERLRERGLHAEGRAVLGNIPEAIVRTAEDVGADLIVMSTRARTGAARAVLGSVADAVVRTAGTPVFLVPYAAARRSGKHEPDELGEDETLAPSASP